jgi:succinoglycan biosynthesis transport protein ExoP
MESKSAMSLPPRELIQLVWSRRMLWLGTTAACGLLAAAYSLVMPRYWEAWQGLVVRQETAGASSSRPGKFADLYEMRTLQETILEVAKSQQVIIATLTAVDPDAPPPTLEDIEEFRKRLKMLPPDGGEFGKSEVFYFLVRAKSRDRAMRLVGELCQQLEIALKDLRTQRAASLIAELEEQLNLTADALADDTQRLMEFETQVGADLGELRMLHSANSGQSDLRLEAVQLETDVRKFRAQVRQGEKLIALLEAAQKDPRELIATPNSLLTTQPALRRLKDGLVDAQLATSRLGGTRSPDHPRVRAAIEAERQIRDDLHDELLTAIRGAEVELQLSRDQLAAIQGRLDNLQSRFTLLAEERAEYSNRVAAVDNRRQTLDRARENLSTAKAAQAAAQSGSLVTRLDKPETGPHPTGPGRTVITGAGAVAGFMLGLGLTFLLASSPATAGAASPLPRRNGHAFTATEAHNDVNLSLAPVAVKAKPRTTSVPAAAKKTESDHTSNGHSAEDGKVQPDASPILSNLFKDMLPDFSSGEFEDPASYELPALTPTPSARPVRAPSRTSREPLPVAAGVLPQPAGVLPETAGASGYSGLSLQDALRAAARQLSN